MLQISRQFADNPSARQEFELFKAKMPALRELLHQFMHEHGYYFVEESLNLSLLQALKASLKTYSDVNDKALTQKVRELFLEESSETPSE